MTVFTASCSGGFFIETMEDGKLKCTECPLHTYKSDAEPYRKDNCISCANVNPDKPRTKFTATKERSGCRYRKMFLLLFTCYDILITYLYASLVT